MSQSIPNKQQEQGTNPELKQQQTILPESISKEKPMISRLINSVHYFIQYVFILRFEDKYRLVALNKRKILMDRYYPTERGCRIAFQKIFKDKACLGYIKPEWSIFYSPDKQWLGKKCKYLEY